MAAFFVKPSIFLYFFALQRSKKIICNKLKNKNAFIRPPKLNFLSFELSFIKIGLSVEAVERPARQKMTFRENTLLS